MRIKILLLLLILIFAGFVSYHIFKPIPPAKDAVSPFDIEKYTGKWYEIARLDFYWEEGLSQVTAEYTLNSDGTLQVDNKGFDAEKNKWKQSNGKAKFLDDPNTGALKVSFFGPFYSGYNVVKIDPDYRYALVYGENLENMWILSRTKTIPEDVKNVYLNYAGNSGYRIEDLIWTVQD